jgi:hypothetical protein
VTVDFLLTVAAIVAALIGALVESRRWSTEALQRERITALEHRSVDLEGRLGELERTAKRRRS